MRKLSRCLFFMKILNSHIFVASALGIFIAFFFLPLAAIPPFRIGFFEQLESIFVSLWFCGFFAGVWNLLFYYKYPNLTTVLWRLPVIWTPLPLMILSMFRSIFLPTPLLSWVGNPQLVDGIFTIISLMFIAPPLILLIKLKPLKKIIFFTFIVSALILATLTIIGNLESPFLHYRAWKWAPLFFADFLGYLVPCLIVMTWKYRTLVQQRYVHYMHYLFSFVVIILVTHYSCNKTVYYALCVGLITYPILRIPIFPKIIFQRKLTFILFSAMIFMTIGILLCDQFQAEITLLHLPYPTLESRMHLGKMIFLDLFLRPWDTSFFTDIFFGRGWGSYHNNLASNAFLDSTFGIFSSGQWKPTCEFLTRDLINSHNILLEYFNATGLIGLSLFAYSKYLMILSLRKNDFFVGTIFLLSTSVLFVFWFQMPNTLPYMLMSTLLLFSNATVLKLPIMIQNFRDLLISTKLWVFMVFSGTGMLLFIITFHLYSQLNITNKFCIDKPEQNYEEAIDFFQSPLMKADHIFGGFRHTGMANLISDKIINDIETKKTHHIRQSVEQLITIADVLIASYKGNKNSLLTSMNIYSSISNNMPNVEKTDHFIKKWHALANTLLHYLPYRSDIMIPYLSYLTHTKQWDRLNIVANKLQKVNHNDPIATWYKGLYLLSFDHSYYDGILMLQKALKLNIVRFLPIPENEIDKINSQQILNKQSE